MTRWFPVALAAVALSCALALGIGPSAAQETLEIPVLLSLTGPYAFLGKQESETFHGVEKLVNRTGGIRGRTLHFAINDIQSSPTTAVQLAAQLVSRHPAVIMGPEPGAAVNAITPIVKSDVVLYSLSGAAKPAAGGYVFTSSTGTRDMQIAGIRYLRSRGVKRLAVIATNDATGVDQIAMVDEAMKLPENAGLSVVDVEHFAGSDLTVAAQIARIKAANPDAVWIGATGTPFGTVAHAMTDAGMAAVPAMTNTSNVLRVQMVQYASFLPKEVYFSGALRFMERGTDPNRAVANAQLVFYDSMRSMGMLNPDVGDNNAWDAIMVVVNALRTLGPDATAAQIHSYILGLHDFAVTNGLMDFRDGSQRGLGLDSNLVVRWDPAKNDWIAVSGPGGRPLTAH